MSSEDLVVTITLTPNPHRGRPGDGGGRFLATARLGADRGAPAGGVGCANKREQAAAIAVRDLLRHGGRDA